ncbi:MAG: YebC/PmpR family DNA-binding transcriptional regulator [Phycisphaerales bacterium]
MARHSHWANIKRKKAKTDAKRGKAWTKCARAIMVAARQGGSDPSTNLALQYAIEEARYENMPRETIERAAKKGAGELGAAEYEALRYEGYGPGGVAILCDTLTDNRTRLAAEMRLILTKYGGNLGATGSVAYMFEHKGLFTLEEDAASEDRLMEVAIDAGAEDVSLGDGVWTVTCVPTAFIQVKAGLAKAGLKLQSAELAMLPTNLTTVGGDNLVKLLKMIDALEDQDDVQKVYTTLDASEEELTRLGA